MLVKLFDLLGLLISVAGVYKLYSSIRPETKTYVGAPGKDTIIQASFNYDCAKEGMRFLIYGLLIQIITIMR